MHEPPQWSRTVSDRAIITRAEALEWIGVSAKELSLLIKNGGFPPPRITGLRNKSGVISSTCRWFAGDVRAWLNGKPASGSPAPMKDFHERLFAKKRQQEFKLAEKTDKTCRD